jgi:hypothetical protein
VEDEENHYHLQDRHRLAPCIFLDKTNTSLTAGIAALKRGRSSGEFAGDRL